MILKITSKCFESLQFVVVISRPLCIRVIHSQATTVGDNCRWLASGVLPLFADCFGVFVRRVPFRDRVILCLGPSTNTHIHRDAEHVYRLTISARRAI